MSDEKIVLSSLEEDTEMYYPVLEFRWWQPKAVNGYLSARVLQQLYISNTGKKEWQNIPTVWEDE